MEKGASGIPLPTWTQLHTIGKICLMQLFGNLGSAKGLKRKAWLAFVVSFNPVSMVVTSPQV